MNKSMLCIFLACAAADLMPGASYAQSGTTTMATSSDAPNAGLSANLGVVSDYVFRGVSQSGGDPAVQGGVDYRHASGFYAGTWASSVSWPTDFGLYSSGRTEWDFYGGFKQALPGSTGLTYDLGTRYYYFSGNRNAGAVDLDTWEVHAGLGWKWASAKWSYTVSDDSFGLRPTGDKSRGTWYLDVSAAYPIADTALSLIAHYGHLRVSNDGAGPFKASYDDWKLGIAYLFTNGWMKGLEIGGYYTNNNAERAFYTDLTGYNTARERGVAYLRKTF